MISLGLLYQLYINISCIIAIILIFKLITDKRSDELIKKHMPTFEINQAKILISLVIILTLPILPFILIYALWIKR